MAVSMLSGILESVPITGVFALVATLMSAFCRVSSWHLRFPWPRHNQCQLWQQTA